MPQKRKKSKRPQVVHFFRIKGLWGHFFALCTLVTIVLLLLSPFVDVNPTWTQPPDHPSYHTALDTIPGIQGVPIRFVELADKEAKTMYLRPGQTVRLIFSNSGPVGVYDITIPGYMMHMVGWNDALLEHIVAQDRVSVLPGKNVHVLFTPTWYASLPVTGFYRTGGHTKYTKMTVLNIQVQGLPMLPSPLPIKLEP